VFCAGIDYSTKAIDLVLVDIDWLRPPWWHRFELHGPDAWERTRTVARTLPGRTSQVWDEVLAFGLEEPRGQNSGVLYRVQGAILAALPPHVLVYPMVPSEWRKACGLKGNASKEDIGWHSLALRANHAGDLPLWPQDAHDAHLIALATHRLINQQEKAA
jgi:hypothetical protein